MLAAARPPAGAPPYAPPSFVGSVNCINSTNTQPFSFPAHYTPASSRAIIRMVGRAVSSSVGNIGCNIGGVDAQVLAYEAGAGAGSAFIWLASISGVPTGSPVDVEFTGTAFGNIIARISHVETAWAGAIGGVGKAVVDGAGNVSDIRVSCGRQRTGAFVIGIAGAVNGLCDPYTVSGAAKDSETETGAAAGTDVSAVFFSTSLGTADTTMSVDISSATGWPKWAGGMVEVI